MKKLIIIPGTFNPVTAAHLEMGRLAAEFVKDPSYIIYVPSNPEFMSSWGKNPNAFMPDTARYEILKQSLKEWAETVNIASKPVIRAEDCELKHRVNGTTIETVKYLAKKLGKAADGNADAAGKNGTEGLEIFLCLGDDKLNELPKWCCAEELFSTVHTLIFTRGMKPGEADSAARKFFKGKKADFIKLDMSGVSSTAVRAAYYEDRLGDVKDMLPAATYRALSKTKRFDVAKVAEDLAEWLRDWFEKNGKGCNAVLGISGGKDSTVAAAICVKALGKDRVIGIMMPDGEQRDIADSRKVCEVLGIRSFEINIHDAVEGVYKGLRTVEAAGVELGSQTRVNLPPRIRMTTVYAVSQSVNGRVINTCNLSEDWVGYSTRYGDSVGDVSPLSHLTVREVKELGKYLGVPAELIDKTPSDGLCGKTDEDNLGFTYAALDRYIRTGDCADEATAKLIDKKHAANLFKLQLMPSYPYDAWE